ncbi:MAG: NADH-quinone oxidoreductase subunit I [Acidobacteria bacterium]|nr:MAG: NADH-quinone oxidoreductase subunit I [Acidobacteriota bacterium]
MDYRVAFVVAALLLGTTSVWVLLASRNARPRDKRTDGSRQSAWTQVDVRYAVVALLFLAFDMEMIYMFPWAVAYRQVGIVAFWDMFVFAAILVVGLVYAWKRGAFDL